MRDFDGVFTDPLPQPRIIRGGAQAFPRISRSYTDQLEDELLRAETEARGLRMQVQGLQAQLTSLQAELLEARQPAPVDGSPALARARKTIERQGQDITRLRAALREQEAQRRADIVKKRAPRRVQVGRLTIHVLRRRVELDGRTFETTQFEQAMLLYLAGRVDEVLDTATIGAAIGSSGGAVRTYMWRLRPKLEGIGAADYLRSKGRGGAWGGYWMTDAGGQP